MFCLGFGLACQIIRLSCILSVIILVLHWYCTLGECCWVGVALFCSVFLAVVVSLLFLQVLIFDVVILTVLVWSFFVLKCLV